MVWALPGSRKHRQSHGEGRRGVPAPRTSLKGVYMGAGMSQGRYAVQGDDDFSPTAQWGESGTSEEALGRQEGCTGSPRRESQEGVRNGSLRLWNDTLPRESRRPAFDWSEGGSLQLRWLLHQYMKLLVLQLYRSLYFFRYSDFGLHFLNKHLV